MTGWTRDRRYAYWSATIFICAEGVVGGIWDIARIHYVRDLVTHLGYPTYFLVLLGVWKVLGAVVLLAPRVPLVKEWAYAGTFFVYTGAMVSHLTTGYALSELWILSVLTVLTVLSWALRPDNRRLRGVQPVTSG
ncbi:MAG: DoxX-like family protein [Nocardia sp.]|uniref:DoxX family protein n=1 Tax=Nocardia sp. TaxID=1821 RepID=UPI00260BAE35|nr:DoxX family protein [Nocardia sp.]MCU1645508.1 DoxX-like family protein [Nocardia sp.]